MLSQRFPGGPTMELFRLAHYILKETGFDIFSMMPQDTLENQSVLLEIFEISMHLGRPVHVMELVSHKTENELVDIRDSLRVLNAYLDLLYTGIAMYDLIEGVSLIIEFKSIIDAYQVGYNIGPLLSAVVQNISIDPQAIFSSILSFATAQRSYNEPIVFQSRLSELTNLIGTTPGELQSRNDAQLVECLAQYLSPSVTRQVDVIRRKLSGLVERRSVSPSVLAAFDDWLGGGRHIAQISEFHRFTSSSSFWTIQSSELWAPFFAHHHGYNMFLAGFHKGRRSRESGFVEHRIALDPRLSLDYSEISPEFGEFLNHVRKESLRDPYYSMACYLRAVFSQRDRIPLETSRKKIQMSPFVNGIEDILKSVLQPEIVQDVMEKIPETFNLHPIIPLLESEDAVKFFVQSPRLYVLSRRLVERFIVEIFLEHASDVYRASSFRFFEQVARLVLRGEAICNITVSSALLDSLRNLSNYEPGTRDFEIRVLSIKSILNDLILAIVVYFCY
jgi:hypothetical protein